MDDDELRDELGRLRARTPEPRAGLTDAVMRQVALRPRPRRSWWSAFTAPRSFTVRFRWSRVTALAGAAAVAFACTAGLRARLRQNAAAPLLAAQPPSATPPAAAASPASTDPQPVLIRFALPARGARAVSLAGDFNGWRPDSTPLERGADGTWTATVRLPPGTWSYSFVVDGKWVEDPFAESYRADGFGGRNALVRVGG
ncbi:MAG TPA: isoamylase early set domain-containing protein [Polyangia bacterium]|nr:isoamylase early set domain-containing protein [Polyangia bacterium]